MAKGPTLMRAVLNQVQYYSTWNSDTQELEWLELPVGLAGEIVGYERWEGIECYVMQYDTFLHEEVITNKQRLTIIEESSIKDKIWEAVVALSR